MYRSKAALNNILFSRTRRLHHLIHSAVALFQKALAEENGTIKYDFGFLKGEQVLVTTMRWNESVKCSHVLCISPTGFISGVPIATEENSPF
jgi:hypothetical protein